MRVVRLFIFLCAFLLLSIPANAIKIGLIDSTPITYVGTSTIGDVIDIKTKNKYIEMLKLYFKALFGGHDLVISAGGNALIAPLLFYLNLFC